MSDVLTELRAIGEETRLRLLVLLSHGELTVANLTSILGQSQPRISRHLKILTEAGVVERYPEGAQVMCRVSKAQQHQALFTSILDRIDPAQSPYSRDLKALETLIKDREQEAERYFEDHATDWDSIRSLYVEEAKIEAALLDLAGNRQFRQQLDLGTGTGRLIDLFKSRTDSAVGVDNNKAMLSIARSRLNPDKDDTVDIRHAHIESLPEALRNTSDLITIHLVLCYVTEPLSVLRQAIQAMTDDGCLLLADFCPHDIEDLRKERAHRRLGFSQNEIRHWAFETGLAVTDYKILKGNKLDVFVARLEKK